MKFQSSTFAVTTLTLLLSFGSAIAGPGDILVGTVEKRHGGMRPEFVEFRKVGDEAYRFFHCDPFCSPLSRALDVEEIALANLKFKGTLRAAHRAPLIPVSNWVWEGTGVIPQNRNELGEMLLLANLVFTIPFVVIPLSIDALALPVTASARIERNIRIKKIDRVFRELTDGATGKDHLYLRTKSFIWLKEILATL